jgi:hypothetical protein
VIEGQRTKDTSAHAGRSAITPFLAQGRSASNGGSESCLTPKVRAADGERGMLPEGWDPASGRLCSPATDVCANLNASASEASERTSTDYELIAT